MRHISPRYLVSCDPLIIGGGGARNNDNRRLLVPFARNKGKTHICVFSLRSERTKIIVIFVRDEDYFGAKAKGLKDANLRLFCFVMNDRKYKDYPWINSIGNVVTYSICLFRSTIDVSAAGLSQKTNLRYYHISSSFTHSLFGLHIDWVKEDKMNSFFLERPAAETSMFEQNKQIEERLSLFRDEKTMISNAQNTI